jgi:hypothetical protein
MVEGVRKATVMQPMNATTPKTRPDPATILRAALERLAARGSGVFEKLDEFKGLDRSSTARTGRR